MLSLLKTFSCSSFEMLQRTRSKKVFKKRLTLQRVARKGKRDSVTQSEKEGICKECHRKRDSVTQSEKEGICIECHRKRDSVTQSEKEGICKECHRKRDPVTQSDKEGILKRVNNTNPSGISRQDHIIIPTIGRFINGTYGSSGLNLRYVGGIVIP